MYVCVCCQIMSEKAAMHPSMARSLTMESISPEDLPRQGRVNSSRFSPKTCAGFCNYDAVCGKK